MKSAVVLAAMAALAAATPLVIHNKNGLVEDLPKALDGHKPHNHHHDKPSSSDDDVRLALDGGWYSFQFGKEGTFVDHEFCFYLHGPAILKLTDYFCSGDRFGVKDNGVWLGPTSYVPFDHCKSNTDNPSEAYRSSAFSHGAFQLAPGSHRITIKVLISPYNGGSAAIRLDSIFNKCPTLKHGLAIIDTHVPFCEASRVCESHGMDLADLDIFNFLDATDVAFQCAGAFSKSWINSWSENDYGHSCLALSTGVAAPGGAINIPDSCNCKLPVLCQARKERCDWDKPCQRHHRKHPSCPEESESCGHHDRHDRHRKPCKPCNQCPDKDWDCWTSCGDDWSFDELECQPHMPCWPQWCLKHGKCDIAREGLNKKRALEQKSEQIKNAQLAQEEKKAKLFAAAQAKKVALEKQAKEAAAKKSEQAVVAKPQSNPAKENNPVKKQ